MFSYAANVVSNNVRRHPQKEMRFITFSLIRVQIGQKFWRRQGLDLLTKAKILLEPTVVPAEQ